jgi:hypothetical protein
MASEAGMAWLEGSFLSRQNAALPPILPMRPPLPSQWPGSFERIDFNGWSYRTLVDGIHYAWPTDPISVDTYLRPWMSVADAALAQMMEYIDRRGGPLLVGVLVFVGQIGDGPTRVYFPDGVTIPMWYGGGSADFEFVPLVALAAPRPLRTLLSEMIRCFAYSGRLTEEEYCRMAGEESSPEEGVTRDEPPGRAERIGHFSAAPDAVTGQRPNFFLLSGYIAEPDCPTFEVTPDIFTPDERWPAMLKRDNLLGRSLSKQTIGAAEGVA